MTETPFEPLMKTVRTVLAARPEIEVVERMLAGAPRLTLTRRRSDGSSRYMQFTQMEDLIPGIDPLFGVLFGEFGNGIQSANYDGRQIADVAHATTLMTLFLVDWTTAGLPYPPLLSK